MPNRPLLLPLLTAALLMGAGACGDRERPAPPPDASGGDAPAGDASAPSRAELRRMAEDSARAVREARQRADSVAEQARQAAGVAEDGPPARAPESTPGGEYAHCMQQAQAATGPVRETIVRACERLREGQRAEP